MMTPVLLIRNLRTKEQVLNEEMARLREIEQCARNLCDRARFGADGKRTVDAYDLLDLKEALAKEKTA